MKKRTPLLSVLFAPLLTIPQTGWSQPGDLFVEGFLGAGVGYYRLNDEEFPDDRDSFDDDRIAWKAFGGIDFSRVLGLEVAYLDFGETSNGLASLEATGWTVAGIVAFPITETFAPYGKLGRLYWDADRSIGPATQSNSGDDMFFALGARFGLAERLDMRLEYERFSIEDTDIDLASINFQFRF